jgi:flavin-dependent dehydrogenase
MKITSTPEGLETCGLWDVIVVGGALSGAATALMLKREIPDLKILIVEKSEVFKRRVGEATVEVSGYFLCRVLGLTQFLTQTQICKNGLRFWFANRVDDGLEKCSEIGGKYLSSVPSFLVDRAQLDEEIIRKAESEGVQLLRPALVKSVNLLAGGQQRLQVQIENAAPATLSTRWVIDASGVRCLLARANDWWIPNEKHPTLAGWSRWKCCKDWDSLEISHQYGQKSAPFIGIRGTATNHIIGEGWWAWWISLKGGDTSIGVVLDQRLSHWTDATAPVGEKLRSFLSRHPAAQAMMSGAHFIEGDVHFRRNLPYSSSVHCGDGFILVGDASAFLDPFYSPGMDWIAFTSCSAVQIISEWKKGGDLAAELERHNTTFSLSYTRSFEALYENKYCYMGDFELMQIAFRLDIGFYYLFVAGPIYRDGLSALVQPPYSHPHAGPIFWLMRLYNRRLAAIANKRRKQGRFGLRNSGHRDLFGGFNFKTSQLFKTLLQALLGWGLLEARELFHGPSTTE